MDYRNIPGWFDFEDIYGEQVAEAASGAHFVEVGAWLGRSTAFMADAIRRSGKVIRFDTIDTWLGSYGDDNHPEIRQFVEETGDAKGTFLRNMRNCGLNAFVRAVESDSTEAAALYEDQTVDFVFIDGDHSTDKVYSDLRAWWPKVRPGGTLAGHDFIQKGPHDAVVRFCEEIEMAPILQKSSFVITKPDKRTSAFVMLGMPNYGTLKPETAMAGIARPTRNKHRISINPSGGSLLAANFNRLWCEALNNRTVTHFAMLHSDIAPQHYWIDILLSEMEKTNADLISVATPIKDARGVSSCGIANAHWPWSPKKRFTMRELGDMPMTFNAESAGYPGECLLFNTGCWIANLASPKWRELDEDGNLKAFFTIRDCVRMVDEKLVAMVQSEDWFFSARVHELGLRAFVTRKVTLVHVGEFAYPNHQKWGNWEHDRETESFWGTDPEKDAERHSSAQPAAQGHG